MAPMILGRPIEGVWHSGIQINNLEYFYGLSSSAMSGPSSSPIYYNLSEIFRVYSRLINVYYYGLLLGFIVRVYYCLLLFIRVY